MHRGSTTPRTPSPEGAKTDTTRQRLLEAAGHVIGDRGFDRATGKEICERAGANSAAVNYYFGGMNGLYAAVLDEAHHRLITLETLSAALAGQTDPKEKLRIVIRLGVKMLMGPIAKSWVLRVVAREISAPSLAFASSPEAQVQNNERLVRLGILKGIASEIMGLPIDHPAVARGCMCVMAPITLLMIADRDALAQKLPGLGFGIEDAEAWALQLANHAIAGLAVTGNQIRLSA